MIDQRIEKFLAGDDELYMIVKQGERFFLHPDKYHLESLVQNWKRHHHSLIEHVEEIEVLKVMDPELIEDFRMMLKYDAVKKITVAV
jgi:hypothetical protein